MPIYEYACSACGHKFEEWQKMSDPPVRTCPKCKKKKVEKLISATAFQLKGGGWYSDLYASSKPGGGDSKGESSSKSDSGDSKGASKSESTGDSKPAAKESSSSKDKKTAKKAESRAA